jgi:ribosomal protein L11 methyltransferase
VNWIEVNVSCDGEAAEAVSELFNRFNPSDGEGWGGAVVEVEGFNSGGVLTEPKVTVRTYLPAGPPGASHLRRIQEGLWHLGQIYPIPEAVIRELAAEDWSTAWRKHYQPLRVGRRLIVVPAWMLDQVNLDSPENNGSPLLPIIMDPGMAFGTGLHPSTRLCLAALEDTIQRGDGVLDVGCGSGILSIAAARLGAGQVLATDVDPVAVEAARENCRRNGVDHLVTVRKGSLPERLTRPSGWSVVVVNILAEVIGQLLEEGLDAQLAGDGFLILSGIISERTELVLGALKQRQLKVVESSREGDWIGLVAQRV